MNDEFQFGERAKRPARVRPPRPSHPKRSFDLRLVWIAAGLVVAGVLAFVLLSGADEAGDQIADSQLEAVGQVDRAYDAAARGTAGRAVVVAQSLYAEHGASPPIPRPCPPTTRDSASHPVPRPAPRPSRTR